MNDSNLKTPTTAEARERGKKGGIASGEARRKRKLLREAFEILLEREIEDKNGNAVSGTEALALQVYKKALKGDLRAFEIIRDTTGQRPTEDVRVAVTSENDELKELIASLKGGDANESGE